MNRTKSGKRGASGMWMAALGIVAMAGCASESWRDKSDDNSGYRAPDSRSSATGNMGGMQSSSTAATADTTAASGLAGEATYGVVQAIDQMQRQDLGTGAIGAAAAGGTVGASGEPMYRVTVRMDDGSSQMMAVDAMPAYKVGDRVRYSNGVLTAY